MGSNTIKWVKGIVISCFLSTFSWGQEGFIADDLIVYPKDVRGTAKQQLLQIIDGAKKTIDMAAYQVKDPQITDMLIKKGQQGVQVRLILETNHYKHDFNVASQDATLASLQNAGIEIHDGPTFLKEKATQGHMHARYLIIDGQLFVLTTGNFDETTFDHCRDFAVAIKNNDSQRTKFRLFQEIFDGDWANKPLTLSEDQGSVILGPEGQRKKIINFLRSATKTLQIYQQFCNDPEVLELLLTLKQNGVEIQVLMMANPTGYDKIDPNQDMQDRLSKAGVKVKLVDIEGKIYMHARSIIVDDTIALIGTASLSAPSLDNNRELSVLIRGGTVKTLCEQFSKDWAIALNLEQGRKKTREMPLDWNKIFNS